MRPGSRRPRADRHGLPDAGRLSLVARRVLEWEGAPAGSHVDITLLSAAAMRRTNRRATGRRSLTDVIAYPLPQPDGRVIGDLYICPAAAPRGVDLCEELIRLTVHGTLHVLGYDHPASAARTRSPMWRRQEQYVTRILS